MKIYINSLVKISELPNGFLATLTLQKQDSKFSSRRGRHKGIEYIASNSKMPPMPGTDSLGNTNENDPPSPPEEEKNTVDTTGNAKNLGETSNTVDTTGNPK